MSELRTRAETALQSLTTAAAACGLIVNSSKTELLQICRLTNQPCLQLTLSGVTIAASDSVRSLGVFLDAHLNFEKHVNYALARAEKLFFALRRAASRYAGADRQFFITIYERIIIPTLFYGVSIWCNALYKQSISSRLYSLERMVLLAATGCLRTTPTEALRVLCGVDPIIYYAHRICARRELGLSVSDPYDLRALIPHQPQHSKTPVYRQSPVLIRRRLLQTYIPDLPHLLPKAHPNQWPPPWLHMKTHQIHIKPSAEASAAESLISDRAKRDPNIIRIYTDASTKDARTTAAFTIYRGASIYHSSSFNLGECATFLGELQAIALALRKFIQLPIGNGGHPFDLYLFSDSQAALQSLKQSRPKWPQAVAAAQSARALIDTKCAAVTLHWIPAHTHIFGNDHADWLAKQAHSKVASVFHSSYRILPTMSDWLRKFTARLRADWQQQWTNLHKARKLWMVFPHLAAVKLPHHSNRRLLVILHQLLVDHAPTKAYLHRFGGSSTSACSCGFPEEDRDHLLFTCPLYAALRPFGFYFVRSPDWLNFITAHLDDFYNMAFKIISARWPSSS